ncbi:MAG TPA: twin-arginine translocation signal domain-containing protein, partial [Rubrivivax sp.]|nr:twin-arginine translocation signal domain-containing protein [Rubrivivax sp.]
MHYLKDRGFVHANTSEITPHDVYLRRRQLIQGLGAGGVLAALGAMPSQAD